MTPYYYRPIKYYDGKVLKCAGMVSEDNAQWLPEQWAKLEAGYLPGFIVTDSYMGDRINAADLSPFNG